MVTLPGMSMADYLVASHHVLESMPAEQQLPQKLGRRWVDMRPGNTLRVCSPDGAHASHGHDIEIMNERLQVCSGPGADPSD